MTYQVQVSIPMHTNIPEDVVTNTLYFKRLDAGPATDVDFGNLITNLSAFYSGLYGNNSTTPVTTFASYMRPAGARMKVYDLTDVKPRPPVLDAALNLSINQDTVTSVPNEVAVCMSFRTEPVPGVAVGSQRGRIYLGGLGDLWIDNANTASFPSVKVAAFQNVAERGLTLFESMLEDEWGWVVHSTKLNQDFAVAEIFCDNAFDTQRRRGNKATLRATRLTPEGP